MLGEEGPAPAASLLKRGLMLEGGRGSNEWDWDEDVPVDIAVAREMGIRQRPFP